MRIGEFEQAVREFGAAAEAAGANNDPAVESDALSRRADAHLSLGQTEDATRDLRAALALAEKGSDALRTAAVLGGLGRAQLLAGQTEDALRSLQESGERARALGSAGLQGAALINLGLALAASGRLEESVRASAEAADLAIKAGNASLAAKALANAAGTSAERGDLAQAADFLARAGQQARAAPESHDQAFALTAIGQLYRRVDKALPSAASQQHAYNAYADAAQVAGRLGDRRAASYALGYLGQLYEDQKRFEDALSLTRQALFLAQQVGAPEMLFLWHWQTGRLQKAQGDMGGAIAAYRQAVHNLQAIRQDSHAVLPGGTMSFREAYGPVYFELADLLLKHASASQGEAAGRSRAEARSTIELLKAAELRDYFQDNCVTSLQARTSGIDSLGDRTAAVYPVILSDRLELLVSLRGEIRQFTVPVSGAALTDEIRALRKTLVKRTTREYLPHARRLYDWLVGPMESALKAAAVDTLVFVPDGALRTIPMGALHDGRRFLIERYAVGTSPGLTLTDARPLKRDGVRALLTGVSKPLRGFPGLPDVTSELSAIGKLYGGKVLLDTEFRIAAIEQELAATPYSIVHIASHAQFDRDPRKTFLLAFDDSLTMNKLEQIMAIGQFRREPVELLTLSACQTAAGDDRAALGMAGAAVKAGARSVLASLWFVSDVSTSVLIAEFYRQLKDPSASKAQALQSAQRKLLAERHHRHPGLWSPFLLIGNWL